MQEFVVEVIRRRSPCTPTRGIATRSSPDLNKVAVLGVLFAPYNDEDGRECTYYERRAIAKETTGATANDDGPSSRLCPSITRTTLIAWEDCTVASVQIEG